MNVHNLTQLYDILFYPGSYIYFKQNGQFDLWYISIDDKLYFLIKSWKVSYYSIKLIFSVGIWPKYFKIMLCDNSYNLIQDNTIRLESLKHHFFCYSYNVTYLICYILLDTK